MNLVSMDPGIRCCGVAVFKHDGTVPRLARALIVRNPVKSGDDLNAVRLMAKEVLATLRNETYYGYDFVSEWPQVYRAVRSKGDPNDLMPLAGVVGFVASASWGSVRRFLPAEWKGQMPKDVCEKRALSRLDAAEQVVLAACAVPASLRHNVIDAVAIGLHAAGRLAPQKAMP